MSGNNTEYLHRPVMLEECIEALDINPEGIYIDGTAGGGGHSYEIARRLTSGKLIAIDQDADAVKAAGERLSVFGDRVTVVKNNFANLADVCRMLGIERVNGVLCDLGVSSYQLDNICRGFAYSSDARLDMRMDRERNFSAWNVVNEYSEDELKRIIYQYGEERYAPVIASKIIKARETAPINTTFELVRIIKSAVPDNSRGAGHHPAKRTFQAIRIEVNGELDVIEPAIRGAFRLLEEGGRMAVITFHSLEDRIVKQTFASLADPCTCPKDFPVCVCGRKPSARIIGRKPITPGAAELESNPRSRSAKLRVAEKI